MGPVANEVYGWIVFLALFVLAWDGGATAAIARLNKDAAAAAAAAAAASPPLQLRRPYLLALCVYSIAVAWFNVVFFYLMLFCLAAFVDMTLHLDAPGQWYHIITEAIVSPDALFAGVGIRHLKWHAAVVLASIAASGILVGFFATDEDLEDDDTERTRSKVVRAIVVPPACAVVMYVVYAVQCVFGRHAEATEMVERMKGGPSSSSVGVAVPPQAGSA